MKILQFARQRKGGNLEELPMNQETLPATETEPKLELMGSPQSSAWIAE